MRNGELVLKTLFLKGSLNESQLQLIPVNIFTLDVVYYALPCPYKSE